MKSCGATQLEKRGLWQWLWFKTGLGCRWSKPRGTNPALLRPQKMHSACAVCCCTTVKPILLMRAWPASICPCIYLLSTHPFPRPERPTTPVSYLRGARQSKPEATQQINCTHATHVQPGALSCFTCLRPRAHDWSGTRTACQAVAQSSVAFLADQTRSRQY